MNYSTQACINTFTADQVTRMRATMMDHLLIDGMVVSAGRKSLTESIGCEVPGAINSTAGYCTDEPTAGNLAFQAGLTEFTMGDITMLNYTADFDSDIYGSAHVTHCDLTTHENGVTVAASFDTDGFDLGNGNHVKVFIDYNNDGDFDDSNPNEEVLLVNNQGGTGVLVGNIVLPTRAAFPSLVINEPLKMRVVTDITGFTTGTNITPCNVDFGQIEDFNIMITNALPVNLISYELSKINQKAKLDWIVDNEIDNDFYKIERSSDGTTFQHLATVSAQEYIGARLQYSHIDNKPTTGKSYYRLTQFDFDGQFEVLGVRSIEFTPREIKVYPNPVQNNTTIGLPISDNTWSIELYNITGQKIDIPFIRINDYSYNIDMNTLSAGSYILKASDNSDVFIKNILKY